MGGWSVRIGNYEMSQIDYYYDDIFDEFQTLEYYQSKTVQVDFKNLTNKTIEKLEVPLYKLHDFEKHENSDLYYLTWHTEKKCLRIFFWEKLKELQIKIVCAFRLNIFVPIDCDSSLFPKYYLNSKPMDNNIQVSTKRVEFEIENLEALDWIGQKGFYQC